MHVSPESRRGVQAKVEMSGVMRLARSQVRSPALAGLSKRCFFLSVLVKRLIRKTEIMLLSQASVKGGQMKRLS